MGKNDKKSLSWDDFQLLGNPNNAPEVELEKPKGHKYNKGQMVVRVHLEKKGRGGKSVSLIRGLDIMEDDLKALGKKLKAACGVGGSVKNKEIIIQGEHRDKIINILKKEGFTNVKKAGG